MKKFVIWTFIIMLTLTLTSCWDAKDVQELQYITALGIDYKDDTFIIHGQVMSFSGIAKQEGSQMLPTPVWVAKGYGKTIITAMNDFYRKSNQPIYWGHVDVIIYSENVLKMGIKQVNNSLLRFQQIRETAWVYGTNESIDEILLMTSLFGSPAQSSLFNPYDIYKLYSYLPPLRIQRLFVDNNESGMTVKLPLLKIRKAVWKDNSEKSNTAKMGGAYLIKNNKFKGKLIEKEILGLRWVTKQTKRSPLVLKADGNLDIVVSIIRPDVEIIPEFNNGDVRFIIKIRVKGSVADMEGQIALSKLEKEIKRHIRNEVMESFKNGLEIGADLYNLEEVVYRKNNKEWKKLFKDKEYQLTPESIKTIDVQVSIQHTGDFKFKQFE